MSSKSNSSGGSDHDTHHLLDIREMPASLIELRKELGYHPDITDKAQHGETFAECLAIICTSLDIVVDGVYDIGPFCEMLLVALRARRFGYSNVLSHKMLSLVPAEIVETAEGITLQRRDENVSTILPEGAIVVEDKKEFPKKETATAQQKVAPSEEPH